jgi:hypothetical protein
MILERVNLKSDYEITYQIIILYFPFKEVEFPFAFYKTFFGESHKFELIN